MTYRVGRKKKLVILDNNSLDVAHFRPGFESLAQTVCDLLNKQTDVNPHVMQAEGSDGVSGAAVGQRSVDTNAEARECETCKHLESVNPYPCGKCDEEYSMWEAPSGGHL